MSCKHSSAECSTCSNILDKPPKIHLDYIYIGHIDKALYACLIVGRLMALGSEDISILLSMTVVQVEALAGEALARIAAHPALLLPRVAA